MNRIHLPGSTLLSASLLCLAAAGTVIATDEADEYDLQFAVPALDRWMYPFNGAPGFQWDGPVFGPISSLEDGFHPSFDNRDGQLIIGFDLSQFVPTGLDTDQYHVSWVEVRATVANDLQWVYDPTPDPWQSWLPPSDPNYIADPDPGRPLELFLTGFRNGWSASTFPENGPFCNGCDCFPPALCKAQRSAFPIQPCTGEDISNSFDNMLNPDPLAVGFVEGLDPGDLVEDETVVTFTVYSIGDSCVQEYFANAFSEGMVDLIFASIFFAEEQQAGGHPALFCKDHPAVTAGIVDASQMDISVRTGPLADLNVDGEVDTIDFLILLGSWGPCEPCPPLCIGDLNGDCVVDTIDFLILLGEWSTGG